MLRHSRYNNIVWKILDAVTCVLLVPFEHVASLTISAFIFTSFDKPFLIHKLLRYFVVCPVMVMLSLLLLPVGFLGYVLWMLINALADVQPFIYVCPEEHDTNHIENDPRYIQNKITVCSANTCLGTEHICRFNSQRSSYWRVHEIGRRLLLQDSLLNKGNLVPPVSRENVILTKLPDVDVFLLQEIFSRYMGHVLHSYLKDKYPYCIYDVGYHTLLGNHGGLGSGLFVASKFPILDAKFLPYSTVNGYGNFCNLGVLVVKFDLGLVMQNGLEQPGVGYIANTHTQAYQGPEKIIAKQLQDAENLLDKFIDSTKKKEEQIVFTIIGGDFNCDNMSPGDETTQNLSLWDRYLDPCRESPGEDKPWAIGTEHRQRMMHHPKIHNSQSFREILIDDVQRRHFIIDADVIEQTMDLMKCPPKTDDNGEVKAMRGGGCRRIDYLLTSKSSKLSPTGFWFSTAIGGLTDHIPVVLMCEEKAHSD